MIFQWKINYLHVTDTMISYFEGTFKLVDGSEELSTFLKHQRFSL